MKVNNDIPVKRAYSTEYRAETGENNEHRIIGHAAVFGSKADIYGYYEEVIERGAFDGCKFKDVIFCINHDTKKIPLARSRNNTSDSTLRISVDDKGLAIDALLDTERNTEAAALYSATERGDMGGMSFIFKVAEDRWEGLDTDKPVRHIEKIAEVFEVTAATFPFYQATDMDARAQRSLESDLAALESARNEAKNALESANTSRQRELYKTRAKLGI